MQLAGDASIEDAGDRADFAVPVRAFGDVGAIGVLRDALVPVALIAVVEDADLMVARADVARVAALRQLNGNLPLLVIAPDRDVADRLRSAVLGAGADACVGRFPLVAVRGYTAALLRQGGHWGRDDRAG